MSPTPVFTIGHSTRTLEEFVALLRVAEVTMLVDVWSVPRSRTNRTIISRPCPKPWPPIRSATGKSRRWVGSARNHRRSRLRPMRCGSIEVSTIMRIMR